MRPSLFYLSFFTLLILLNSAFLWRLNDARDTSAMSRMHLIADITGLTDPAFTTEARYTRHLGLTDSLVPFMDHPGALEHFPSSAMLAPHGAQ